MRRELSEYPIEIHPPLARRTSDDGKSHPRVNSQDIEILDVEYDRVSRQSLDHFWVCLERAKRVGGIHADSQGRALQPLHQPCELVYMVRFIVLQRDGDARLLKAGEYECHP